MTRKYLILSALILGLSGCGQNSDSDLLTQAKDAINRSDFNSAISLLSSIKNQTDEVISLRSEAHAGLSGFTFFKVLDNLISSKSASPIELIFNLSDSGDSKKSLDISSAVSLLENSKSKSLWTGSIHLKYSFFEFFKASIIMKTFIKNKPIQNWNPCSEEELPSESLREVIVSINKGIDSINTSIQKENINNLNGFAEDVNQIAVQSNGEYKVLESQLTAQEIKGFRSLINSNVVARGILCPQ